MDWKAKSKKLKDVLTQRERERAIREQEKKKLSGRTEQEHKQAVQMLSPRVGRVCKAFAHGIKGKFRSNSSLLGILSWDYELWGNYDKFSEFPPSKFAILGPKEAYGIRHEIIIKISADGVLVSTHSFTKPFFDRLSPVVYPKPSPPLSFFRQKEVVELSGGNEWWWHACYFIPLDEFTEDRLGDALEVFCEEIISEEVTIFPHEGY